MSSGERAGDAMNASLLREYKQIRARMRSGATTIEVRHAIGRIVAVVRADPERYGKRAVAALATALGRDEATLYRFAQVAARWTTEELAAWIARGRASGHPLSWWHLVKASAIPRKRDREELLERSIDEGLSVRALGRLAEAASQSGRGGGPLVREIEGVARRATALRERCSRLVGRDPAESRRQITRGTLERATAALARLATDVEKARADVDALAAALEVEETQ